MPLFVLLWVAAFGLASNVCVALTDDEAPQNVLLLVADDAGFEMGAYLNKYCQTPNLDALAKSGLIFNNAFTSVSSCSPSRAQLLTGQASHSSGMYGLHQGVHNFNVLPQVASLPNVLSAQKTNILSGIIGKKHVGAADAFRFDFEQTEEQHPINQIGRNITKMKLYARKFLSLAKKSKRPFLLVVGFHDPHRCGHITPQFGEFCERWGSGEQGMGSIPDWKPIYYDWRNLQVPAYLPDTDVVRQELAAQYMTMSRLDQGVGLILSELRAASLADNTLVIFTSDNGPPFPGGRTNFYEHGIRAPLIISSPVAKSRHHQASGVMTSLLDIYPTVLDALRVPLQNDSRLSGSSLLPVLQAEPMPLETDAIYGSQNFHEVTMSYPMRMVRNRRYKLIHNLNFWSYFPIDKDLSTSPTFQQILNATMKEQPLPWYKTLRQYYQRPEWELYDIVQDALERRNLAEVPAHSATLKQLRQQLFDWQHATADPWRCAPHAVLQDQGVFKRAPVCLSLGHEALRTNPFSGYEKYVIIE